MSQMKTPNVPKTKDSFFHRKYRDMLNCPPTPSSTSKRRTKRCKLQKNDQNDSITSDYSTPKTTRTPTSARLRGNQRITHLIYRPLELDTESSSESNENNFRRRKVAEPTSKTPDNSITYDTPLAITNGPTTQSQPIVITISDTPAAPEEVEVTDKETTIITTVATMITTTTTTITTVTTTSKQPSTTAIAGSGSDTVIASSEPPTPPVTPEKVKEEKISSFVPGNVWIFKTS